MNHEKPYIVINASGQPVSFNIKNFQGVDETVIFFASSHEAIMKAKEHAFHNPTARIYLAKLVKFIGSPVEVVDLD
jgi:hypothetical protein